MLLKDYIGNEKIKQQVLLALGSAVKRSEPVKHMLFAGRPGTGKTSLSKVIANLLKVELTHIQSSSLKESADILSVFKQLPKGNKFSIIFIDEIHEMPLKGQEVLGIAMEERILVINNGFYSRKIDLPPFTVLGATTIPGALSKPFLDRFGMTLIFDYYELPDCVKIVKNYLTKKIPEVIIDNEAILAIAKRGRGTPRTLERVSDRVVDYVTVNALRKLDKPIVEEVMKLVGLDEEGLNRSDLIILETLFNAGRPIGLDNLSAVTGEDAKTIASKIEPFLIQKGLVARTGQGRVLTEKGFDYLSESKLKNLE